MWWRVLGVAVLLLGVGLVGGYAVGQGREEQPVLAGVPKPLTAVSPSVPTPPVFDVLPDPTAAPLQPDLPQETQELRITKRGPGVALSVPQGWEASRLPDSQTWSFVPAINTRNTYTLRVNVMIGQHLAATVAKTARIEALRSAEDEGNLLDLQITAETDTSFQATYIDQGYLRTTIEQWVPDENGTAYADVAVTGRTVDQEGLGDLLTRTIETVAYLDPLPPPSESPSPSP